MRDVLKEYHDLLEATQERMDLKRQILEEFEKRGFEIRQRSGLRVLDPEMGQSPVLYFKVTLGSAGISLDLSLMAHRPTYSVIAGDDLIKRREEITSITDLEKLFVEFNRQCSDLGKLIARGL